MKIQHGNQMNMEILLLEEGTFLKFFLLLNFSNPHLP